MGGHVLPSAADDVLREALDLVINQLGRRARAAETYDAAVVDGTIKRTIPRILASYLGGDVRAKGGTGMGDPAQVPWVQVGHGELKAQEGYYVVYLFSADGASVYLSLNQGTEGVRDGAYALRKRRLDIAAAAGASLPDGARIINLGSSAQRPRRYEAANVVAVRYEAGSIPSDDVLLSDIQDFLVAAQTARSTGLTLDPEIEPLHLVMKWDPDLEPRAIEISQDIIEKERSVWWGRIRRDGSPDVSEGKLAALTRQLERGVPTYVYLYHAGSVWRATLEAVTSDRDRIDPRRFPSYHTVQDCTFFALIRDLASLEPDWLLDHLVLASRSSLDPSVLALALRNQANPIYVYERWLPGVPPTVPIDDLPAVSIERRPTTRTPVVLVPTLDSLQRATLWRRDDLEELVDAVRSQRQLVLAGPPGTGKTHVAKALADFICGGDGLAWRVIQLHPTYGYEEFVESLRPVIAEGMVTFDRVDGAVLKLARDFEDRDGYRVLIVDEMNRANLPRVFGELMYALEYREQPVDLLYTKGFQLPEKMLFVGTMNTVDRSARTMDLALRRRFDVFECPPDPGILARFYDLTGAENSVPSLVDGFEALNERIVSEIDRHHGIGHSFFMIPHMTPAHLRHRWRRQIGPLIEEYFFDQPSLAEHYELRAFWPDAAGAL